MPINLRSKFLDLLKKIYSKVGVLSATLRVALYFFALVNLCFLLLGVNVSEMSANFILGHYGRVVLAFYGANVALFYFQFKSFPLVRQILVVAESFCFAFFWSYSSSNIFFLFIIFRQIARFLYSFSTNSQDNPLLEKYYNNPFYLVIISFLLAIFLGAVLLKLPMSVVEGKISVIDAFFTSTSAVCVTGLVVKNTYTYFTLFGQLVILSLIQIGGLGIMTISTKYIASRQASRPFLARQTHQT